MAEYPESVIQSVIVTRIHQGMDAEQAEAVEARVRAELAAEPPIKPMSELGVALIKAGGWSPRHTRRDEEAYRLATKEALG
jgi:hypothetical protein